MFGVWVWRRPRCGSRLPSPPRAVKCAVHRWLDPARSAGARLESDSRSHPQPEAALVSAGRRLRWSRTFPFQRARARELLQSASLLRCSGGISMFGSAALLVIYVPSSCLFSFNLFIHDSLTTLTPFFTLSHLFDGATAIHSSAQSNGYKGATPVPTLPARQRGALFSTGTATLPF
jgi:hypothetical protein